MITPSAWRATHFRVLSLPKPNCSKTPKVPRSHRAARAFPQPFGAKAARSLKAQGPTNAFWANWSLNRAPTIAGSGCAAAPKFWPAWPHVGLAEVHVHAHLQHLVGLAKARALCQETPRSLSASTRKGATRSWCSRYLNLKGCPQKKRKDANTQAQAHTRTPKKKRALWALERFLAPPGPPSSPGTSCPAQSSGPENSQPLPVPESHATLLHLTRIRTLQEIEKQLPVSLLV